MDRRQEDQVDGCADCHVDADQVPLRQLSDFFHPIDRVLRLPAHWLPFLLILVIGAALRISLLNQPLRYDEAVTFVGYASRPLSTALSDYSAPNNHLFHTLLVHLTTLFGTQYREWLVRLPAFLAGLAIIPATYVLGAKLYQREAGLLAAAVTAASAPLIEYSTNARGYSLVTLFFLLLWLVNIELILQPKRRSWLLFSIIAALGFYTIPTMLYGFGIVVVWLAASMLVRYRRIAVLRGLVAATGLTLALTFLLYLPVFLNSGVEAVVGNQFIAPLAWNSFLTELPKSLVITWETWNSYLPAPLPIVLLVGVLGSVFLHRRIARYPIPIIPVVLVCCAVMLVVQRVAPYPRVWLFLLPLYAICAAAGWVALVRLKRTWAAVLAVVLCLLLSINLPIDTSINFLDEAGVEDDAEDIALYIKGLDLAERGTIQVLPPSETLQFYFRKHGLSWRLFALSVNAFDAETVLVLVNTPEYTLERLTRLLQEYGADFSGYSSPELVQTFPFVEIYRLRRL
jgi:hypothetical protein